MPGDNRSQDEKVQDWILPVIGILIALAIAWGIGQLQARETYKRQHIPTAYAEAAKKDAERTCIGTEPSVVFKCVNEKVETAYQTAHDQQDLSAQQRAASSALATTIFSFMALVLSGVGVWFVKRTLDATLEAVEDTGKATVAMQEANRIAMFAQTAQRSESRRMQFRDMTELKRVSESEQRQLRAYIGITNWQQITESGKQIFEVDIKNFGQTPAINLRVARSFRVGSVADFKQMKFFKTGGIHLAPGNSWERIPASMPGTSAMATYIAEIRYFDVFGYEWGLRLRYHRAASGKWETTEDGSYEYRIER